MKFLHSLQISFLSHTLFSLCPGFIALVLSVSLKVSVPYRYALLSKLFYVYPSQGDMKLSSPHPVSDNTGWFLSVCRPSLSLHKENQNREELNCITNTGRRLGFTVRIMDFILINRVAVKSPQDSVKHMLTRKTEDLNRRFFLKSDL